MLANCFVCASHFATYRCFSSIFGFQIFFLVPPFFHCFHALRFSFTALSTLSHHQVSLCRGHPPCVHSHISSAASRKPFKLYSQTLSTSAGICWHFIDTACSNSFCTTVSFNFQVFLLGGIRMVLTGFTDTTKSQTSKLIFTTDHFCIFDVFQLCSSHKDEVNPCMITSRWKSNELVLILVKGSVGNCRLVGYIKIKNVQPILVSHTIPTTSMSTLCPTTCPLKSPPSINISFSSTNATTLNTRS